MVFSPSETEVTLSLSERNLAGFTKFLLDVGYILALCALPALPFLLRWAAPQYPSVAEHRVFHLILFFLGDLGCIFIIRELRRMFRTVLEDRCFVRENVTSLRRMGYYGLGIALVMAVRGGGLYPGYGIYNCGLFPGLLCSPLYWRGCSTAPCGTRKRTT